MLEKLKRKVTYIYGTFIIALNFRSWTLTNQISLTFMMMLYITHTFAHTDFWKKCCVGKRVDAMNFSQDTRLRYKLVFFRMNKKTGETFTVP